MNLLFVIDDGYVDQFQVTLFSIVEQMPHTHFQVYVLQKTLLEKDTQIQAFTKALGVTYIPIVVGSEAFAGAPTTDRYPDTIYYRLLAHEFLPESVEKILYLDADILCLNDFTDFYQMEMGTQLYAAASHNEDGKILDYVNKLRLQNFEMESSYYNTGTLLMNMVAIRSIVKREAILDYIKKNKTRLILPDQDVLNALYADLVIGVPDEIYNYDARYSIVYQLKSKGLWDLDWVINHTIFLHFAGREKPWKSDYTSRYAGLYKYMEKRTRRLVKEEQ
ncbi:glycosyltransferase family 8 protein [Streptococcus cameli]